MSAMTVSKWRKRFMESRLEGLAAPTVRDGRRPSWL
ncbi:hypothetical protein [Streptomyces decoyicus]